MKKHLKISLWVFVVVAIFTISATVKGVVFYEQDIETPSFRLTNIMWTKDKSGNLVPQEQIIARMKDGTRIVHGKANGYDFTEIADPNTNTVTFKDGIRRRVLTEHHTNLRRPLNPKRHSCEQASSLKACPPAEILPEIGIPAHHVTHVITPSKCKSCKGGDRIAEVWLAPSLNYEVVKVRTSVDGEVIFKVDPILLEIGGDYETLRDVQGHSRMSTRNDFKKP